jgi:Mrp family chromosome partitioning ATPase
LFAELIESAKADYDVVLVDSSPADSSADAQSIARVANGSIVVARKNRTLLSDVQALVGALTSAGSTVVGTVLNAH